MKRFAGLICLLLVFGAGNALAEVPTYNKDIAPILWKNCAGCHRPGEIGPFSLLTYKDAAKRSSFLAEVTESRRMPPWKPEPGFGTFHDERRLSEAEIQTIADWAKAAHPKGNAEGPAQPPKFPEGWQLGTPDLVLKATEPFDVPAERAGRLPLLRDPDPDRLGQDGRGRSSSGPGNRRVVHHALLYLDSTGAARARTRSIPAPATPASAARAFCRRAGWAAGRPGAMPRLLPDGIGKFLRKGSDLVLQIHYHPDGKPETDQSVVGIYFTRTPAKKIVAGIAVRTRNLDIPAGESSLSRRPRRATPSRRCPGDRHHPAHALHRQGDEGRRRDSRRQDHPR